MRLCYPTEFKTVSFAVEYPPKEIPSYERSIKFLCELAAFEFRVSPNDIRKSSRIFADPRSVVCYLAYSELNMTLQKIASYFNKDHSTIIHSKTKCENLLATDKEFLKKFLRIKSKMV